MSELKPDPEGKRLIIAIREFLQDWRKGDFELPKLAQYDAKSIESALDNWLVTRQPVHAAETVEACARIAENYELNGCGYISEEANEHFQEQMDDVAKEIRAQPTAPSELQYRVAGWMLECFTPEIAADKLERSDRFIEEALELVQACDYSKDRAHDLVDYVFNRPKGEKEQEVGGVMITLAALCNANGLSMQEGAQKEYSRISQPDIIEKIRAKQAAKPVGSALPIPTAPSADEVSSLETCYQCCGTGCDNHPDSGSVCFECNGSGAIAVSSVEEIMSDLSGLCEAYVDDCDYAERKYWDKEVWKAVAETLRAAAVAITALTAENEQLQAALTTKELT